MELKVASVEPCRKLNPIGRYVWNFARYDQGFRDKAHYVEQDIATEWFGKGEKAATDGDLASMERMFQLAVLHYKQALDAEPGCNLCWFNLGTCYLKQRQSTDALVCLAAALAGNRVFGPALLNLGVACLQLKRFLPAIKLFQSTDPPSPPAAPSDLNLKAKFNELLALEESGMKVLKCEKTLEIYWYLKGHLPKELFEEVENAVDVTECLRKFGEDAARLKNRTKLSDRLVLRN